MARFLDIVPDERIKHADEMHVDENRELARGMA
jgi:hypothetical protein